MEKLVRNLKRSYLKLFTFSKDFRNFERDPEGCIRCGYYAGYHNLKVLLLFIQ